MSNQESISQRLTREFAQGKLDTERTPGIGNVPSPMLDLRSVHRSLQAIRQIIDTREGRAGSVMDKHMTLRDLVDAGLASISIANDSLVGGVASTVLGGTSGVSVVVGAGSVYTGYADPRATHATPLTLTGLTATGTPKTIVLEWDVDKINYLNFAYVEIIRYTSDNQAAAAAAGAIGTSTTTTFTDVSLDPAVTYYYWIRAYNSEGVAGAYNATPGVSATPTAITSSNSGVLASDTAITASPVFFCGAAVDSQSAPVYVLGTLLIRALSTVTSNAIVLELYRGATLILTLAKHYVNLPTSDYDIISFSYPDVSPGSGSHTYNLYVHADIGGELNCIAAGTNLICLGTRV